MKVRLYLFTLINVFLACTLLSPCFSQKLDIEVKTESFGGPVAPRHAVAIWIQTPENELVNTVEVWSYNHNSSLMTWRVVTGLRDTGMYDGITQATIPDHSDPVKITWDCRDIDSNIVPHGTYEFWVEFAEGEYWWKSQDPDEEYIYGRWTKGVIEISDSKAVAYGDTSGPCFTAFKATYVPTGIVFHGKKPGTNTPLSCWYNPAIQKVTIQLNSVFDNSAVLHIIDLKGRIVEAIQMNPNVIEYYWDLQDRPGKKVPSGVYLIKVHSTEPGNIINRAYAITLLR